MSWSLQNHVFWADRATWIQVQSRDGNDLPDSLAEEGPMDVDEGGLDSDSPQTGNDSDPLRVAEVRVIGSGM